MFGQLDGLSTFEEFMLRTIAASPAPIEQIASTLGLDRNVVLDACVDLLRAGYLVLRRADASVEVSELVRDEMGDPLLPRAEWARRLAPSTAPPPREYDLLQELVSGTIFPSASGLNAESTSLLAPEDPSIGDVTSIPKPSLIEATARLARKISESRDRVGDPMSRRGLRVVDVSIVGVGPAGTMPATTPASVVVEVMRRKAAADDRPNLVIVGPPQLNGNVRRRIASKLMMLWDDGVARGKGQFFDRLAERLSSAEVLEGAEELERILNPASSVATLVEAVAGIDAKMRDDSDALEDAHLHISDLERTATSDLDDGASLHATVELVSGAASHHALLLEALSQATYQVVMTSPWVGQLERNKPLQDALIAAVDRGVRVHLLWGVDRAGAFDDEFGPVARDLVQLLAPGAQRTGGLFVATRPAGIHAKLTTCDLSWAVVSSCNVLNSGPDRRELEIGLRIGAPGDAPNQAANQDGRRFAARAVSEILQWVRAVTPDFLLRRLVGDDPAIEGRRLLAPSVEVGGTVAAPGDFNIWRGNLELRAKTLEQRLRKLGAVVHPVMDGQHREYLVAALREARRRLVVSSKDLGVGLLGDATLELLRAARERGVEIAVFHSSEAEWSPDLERRREELSALGIAFHRRDVHAKVLVCDDWAIVTSFNFLSFAGYYDDHRRARHELGARVLAVGIADQLVALLEGATAR